MMNAILIFPIIAGILMLIVRKRFFDNLMLNIYALLHFVITLFLVFDKGAQITIPYFAVDGTNKIFLLVLSFVFLMVTIYNNGYSKQLPAFGNIKIKEKKICLYWLMTMAFVLSMTGTILSTNLGLAWVLVEATTLTSAYLIYFNRTKSAIEASMEICFYLFNRDCTGFCWDNFSEYFDW